jgi:DEAD/DEAH box helicase domain-containing protein
MLHSGILPNHTKWARFFMNLEFIVIDEVHTYRGVFGSHMANVLRRLKRIAAHYGSSPGFICCSATIGNPAELASKVTEEKTLLVSGNGAPSGEKHLVFYNPPLVDRVQGLRRSSALEAGSLAFMLIKEKIKTIVFARSRIRVELIASYLKDSVRNIYTDNSRTRIESYRGGYLPSERRKIEQGLRSGEVTGVVSTNALELGIDIGSLDAAVLAGFPGSISSAWQQAGRAGRRNSVSLAVLVSSASPLDQFYVTHPEYFLATPPEAGFIDPDNIYILTDHVKCAAFELPFKEGESFGCDISSILAYLEEEGVLRKSAGSWYWSDRGYPSENISLRSAAAENIIIIDTTKGRYEPIGEMDYLSARELIFDNAVYMHRSCQYIVKKLDLAEKKCLVEETDVDYFTDSIVKTDIKVLETDNDKTSGLHRAVTADILLRSQVSKFKKLKFRTHENLGYGEIHLPEAEMHTRALALVFGKETTAYRGLSEVPDEGKALVLSQAAKLLKTVSSIYLLCDAADMGSAERVKDPHFKETVLYFYDNHPGGIGLAEAMAAIIPQVLEAALSVIETCPCEAGCPSCTGPADELPSTVPNPKAAVHAFLKIWLKGA